MPWTFNPFSGTFDQKGSGGGGGASYIDGEVQNFSALPTANPPAVDSAYLVREPEGTWLINRKPAGIYIRVATTGTRATDWTYAGILPDVFNDANFLLYDNGDSSKNLAFQLSGITTGTTRTLTVPDASGVIVLGNDSRIVNILKNGASLEFDPGNGNPPLTFAGGAGGSIDLRGADAAAGNAGGAGGSIQQKGGVTGRGGNLTLNAGTPISGLSGRGGDIDATGGYDGGRGGDLIMRGADGSNAGDINTSAGGVAAGGSINTSGNSVSGLVGGSINTSGGLNRGGGSINTSDGGGSINTYGGAGGPGGSINTSAGDSAGGPINTSDGGGAINTSDGGGTLDTRNGGGSIYTRDGGGSIDTRGTGAIGLGTSDTRTTLTGTATQARSISLPNRSGTVVVSDTSAGSGSDVVNNIVSLTQAEYNAIGSPDAATLFLITDP
jgi:hypothetical protein